MHRIYASTTEPAPLLILLAITRVDSKQTLIGSISQIAWKWRMPHMFASNLFAFVIIYLLLIFQRLRKLAAKTNVFLNTCTACFLYWVVLSVYFQEGCFESCAISSTCLLIISVLMANKLIIMTLSPIFEVQRRRIEEFKWFLNAWTILCSSSSDRAILSTWGGHIVSFRFHEKTT